MNSSWTRPWRWSLWRQCILLLALGFSARVFLISVTHEYRKLEPFEVQRAAYSLATKGVLGNPYMIDTGPTAHVSPGYPIILSVIYRIFGYGEKAEFVKEVVSSFVSSLVWALMPLAASTLGVPPLAGFFGGLLGALLPFKFTTETKGDWETPYNALATLLLAAFTAAIWQRRTFTSRRALQSGAAWGLSLLFMSSLLTSWLAFAAAGAFREFSGRYARFAAIQALVVCCFLAPWAIRNKIQLGEPIVTRSNLGTELRLSNNDLATPSERVNYAKGLYAIYHPSQNLAEAERVRALGEPEYNRRLMQQALAWIRTHPRRFLELTGARVVYFWLQLGPGMPLVKALWLSVFGFAGLIGWFFLAHESFWRALPLGLLFAIYPLPYYLVQFMLRYRYPVDWISLLLAVYLVTLPLTRPMSKSENARDSARWLEGALQSSERSP